MNVTATGTRIVAALALVTLVACAGKQELTIEPDAWTFEEQALALAIQPDRELNLHNGRAHALTIGIFQMADPNPFLGLAETRSGALQLLSQGKAADASILDFRRIAIQPGRKHFVTLARPETAQYVGMVFGYYDLEPASAVRLMAYPVVAKPQGFIKQSLVFLQLIADEAEAKPGRLWLRVQLGSQNLLEVRPITSEEDLAGFGEEAAAFGASAEQSGLFEDFSQEPQESAPTDTGDAGTDTTEQEQETNTKRDDGA